jgi:hypothetical protein
VGEVMFLLRQTTEVMTKIKEVVILVEIQEQLPPSPLRKTLHQKILHLILHHNLVSTHAS